ncbi:DUF1990 family protein [Mycolicibacterium sp. P9-64]|uniref:DUF1990 family protein n=1 Tax=Mycolicibacterium sp. P9-64 TaxID=2024612 RepID=UPI0011EFD63F|nr:DUF1990 family protein [Mycolicibacterium sp. P9-64]KAA0081766.1 DUF1990 family protein [Mycolicibacterium sp. P9-64]
MNDSTGQSELSYEGVGLTESSSETWSTPKGFRRFQRTVGIGHGVDAWAFATGEVLSWGVKRRSGFRVSPTGIVSEGTDNSISAGWGPFVVREPVRRRYLRALVLPGA